MKKRVTGDIYQRYSFRKLSVGLVSATIGSFFLCTTMGGAVSSVEAAEVSANQPTLVQYHYVVESDLTEAEKAAIVKELPKFAEENSDAYYLVYRPTRQESLLGKLPKTGESGLLGADFAATGLALVVLVLARGKNGKRYLSSILLVTGLGSVLLPVSVLAVSSTDLAAYNQSLTLAVGDQLPEPLKIAGYQYIGYLKKEAQHQLAQRGNSQLPAPQKEASSSQPDQQLKDLAGRPKHTEAPKEAQPAGGDHLSEKEEIAAKEGQFARQTPVHERPELQFTSQAATQTQEIPYKTEYQYSDDLAEGQSRVIRAGIPGIRKIVTRYYSVEGKIVESKQISDQVTTEPVSEVVLVGTAADKAVPKEAPIHEVPELTSYGTVPDSAPVHEKPELTGYGTVPDNAPVHEKPVLSAYGTVPNSAPVHEKPELTDYGTVPDSAPEHEVPEFTAYGAVPDNAPVHEKPELSGYGTVPDSAPVHEKPELTDYGTVPDSAPEHEVPELTNYGTVPASAPVHEVPELTEYGTVPDTAPVHEKPALTGHGTVPDTAPVQEVPELTSYGTVPNSAPVHEVPELTDYGTVPTSAPVHEKPELPGYGTVPDSAPVHEVPELTNYGAVPDNAPVHEVPEFTGYGTVPDTAPVHEVPELTDYGTVPDSAPVHEVPELTDYGTVPDSAPVHEVPELPGYGTVPDSAPVHEVPELTNYGAVPDNAPVHEVPELTAYGTVPDSAPVHEKPELTAYGTVPDSAPEHEVSELTNYGTVPDNAPVQEVSELTSYGTVPDNAPVHEVPELTEYGTVPDTAPVHEKPELTGHGTVPDTAPVQEVPELTSYGTVPASSPVHEVPELTNYGTVPASAPVQEVPELTSYGVVPDRAPVHEVPALPGYGMVPDTAPVHEKPELTSYGVVPDRAPVHEKPELTDYGTVPANAPVHEVPELNEYGIVPASAPVQEKSELTSYGTVPDTAPVHEVPELPGYGTVPDSAPVHEVPELTGYGTVPTSAPVHEVPELTAYGTVPDNAPVHKVPELSGYGTVPDTAPVHEVPALSGYGTVPASAPVHEQPELSAYGTVPDTAPVHEQPELSAYGTVPDSAPVHEVLELELVTKDETRVEKIAFNIEEQYTDELPQNARQIVTPGVQGERTIKTRVYTSNGQEIARQELSNEETLVPVTQVVKIGTGKPHMVPSTAPQEPALPEYPLTYKDETRVEKIDFTTREEETDELVQGTRQIVTPGVQGERTIKTRVYTSNGQEIDRQEVSNEETLAPVTQLVKIGTAKPYMVPSTAPQESALPEYPLTYKDETRVEKIDFTTREDETDELVQGARQIVTPGVHGERTIKTRIYTSNGQELARQELSNEETLAPATQVVKIGAGKPHMVPSTAPQASALPEYPLTYKDETRVEKIDFTTREEETDELVQGARQVATPGVQGERTIKTRVYTSNGQELARQELSNEETLDPVTQVVKIGTAKPHMVPSTAPQASALPEYPLTYKDETRVEKIDFTTREEETDELVQGARQIVTPGVQGERTIKTRIYSSNGQELARQELSNEETLAPVMQVVKVGTAKPHMVPSTAPQASALPEYPLTYKDETQVEKIDFTTREEETDELVQGARHIVTPGVQGERTIKTRVYTSNGQEIDRQELSNEETRAAVAQLVKVGTIKPHMVPSDAPQVEALKEFDLISLHNLLTEAEQIKAQARYFNDSQSRQAAYDTALAAGHTLLNQSQASQAEVDQLVDQINQAKAQLQGLEVDKTRLQNEHALGRTVQATVQYKNADADKKTAYTNELTKAEGILNNQTATQVQLNQAFASLTASKAALNGVPKVKPTVSILSLTENPEDKSVTVQYSLEDKTKSFRSATAELYKGDQLVRTLPIDNVAGSLKIDDLDYYTGYTLKTKLTYELDAGSLTDLEKDTRNFELQYKKIAFRDIDSAEFYRKEKDQFKRVVSMSAIPTDLSNYFVKVKSSEAKDMLLPVHSMAEGQKDGKAVYKVRVSLPELVQEGETGYKSGYDFYISRAVPSQQNVYTSFAGLVDAMKKNMAGNYVLGADLDASEVSLAPADYVYLRGNFTGSLTGNHNGKQYAIYNLAKPLFENLKSGSSISNLDLKEVNIVGTYDSAALARSADNAQITDVSAQGRVSVVGNASQVAGLVVVASNSQITNSSFTGTIQTNDKQYKAYNVGGLVANLKGGNSLLSQSRADVTILAGARTNEQRFGGLVGRLEDNARISRSYVTGKIQNSTKNGQIGGVVGSNYFNGLIDNVISNVSGTNVYSISGDQDYKNDRIREAYAVEGNETLGNDQFVTSTLSLDEAEEKLVSLDIRTTLEDSNLNLHTVDYSKEKNAREDRLIAYANMEKLLPFYNKETIVAYGNKLPDHHKLNRDYLLDVVPMKGDQMITDIHSNKTVINRLMLHFEDKSVDYLNLTYKGDFKHQAIAEYTVNGLDLLYTPEAFLSDYSRILNQVLPELNKVVLDSPAMRTVLGVNADTSLDELYLDTAFDQVKTKLSQELRKVLAMDKSINTEGNVVADYIAQQIKDNKEAFLLGLTYLNRWYNINYDKTNVKDLSAYKFDFFGNHNASTLDTIISLGKSGMNNLKAKNNYMAYDASLSEATGKRGLFNYLEGYRQLFLPDKSNNEWLKTNTKAYIVEAKSDIAEARQLQDAAEDKSKYSVGVYDKITADNWEHKGMLLPLLTMTEKGVYVISNMSTVSMGAYDRYRDQVDGKVRTDAELAEYVEDRVRKSAEWQRDHYDFWYKILSDESKDKLFRSVLVYDGFLLKDKTGQTYWASANDKRSLAMQEFFGPAGKWYPSKGYNAYATGSVTHFDRARLLEDYGNSVYTHEMTHNSDGSIYFEGYGRREGLGAELYARGLLQSTPSPNEPTITLNTLFKTDKDSKTRMHTYNFKERVQNAADLQHYVHGMFDMIYTLDYLEGTSMVKQSDAAKLQWFRKMENYYITDKYGKQTHAGNQTRSFTAEEIKQLTSFESLIDNDVITRRENKDSGQYPRNGYLSLSLFSPIYSALSNPNGAPGDVMFRRTAYELLAAKGYHEGFVPYVSGKFSEEAAAEGKTTWDGWLRRDVGLVTDQKVLENVFKGEYASWAAFKKAMYQERIDQLTKLKPITIEYELRNPNSTKQVTIRSYAEMQKLMDEAVAEDVRNITNATNRVEASWVNLLKKKIYNAYLRETDDFRQSIFNK
ncbi:SIALI-17 repeat-containing surface protein [Streptococcus cristatus]|uniref:Immunoglobulin A1 protease n=2 Tax=Streptococcus cristatus TaxID=45634 RepID=A0A3R9SYL4_STRCR|nr:SIALI-17 repeat-containing surface protein [Streptococcus cristatus]RSJ89610.1 Immunoglobulin A1 protease precursor [Streptococcus cristatus]